MALYRVVFNALILLLVTPGLAVHTPSEVYAAEEYCDEQPDAFTQLQNGLPLTYDGILKLIEDIEEGELEKRCSLEDLDKINHFLVSLARQGLLPSDDEAALEESIEELYSQDDSPQYAFWTDSSYSIVPAVLSGPFHAILCKSWVQKQWKQTKEFVKENKKPLIIAAAVIVAAVTVIVIVAATAGAASPAIPAVVAAAAGAAGAEVASSDHKESKESKIIPFPSNAKSGEESSLVQSAIDGEILAFKGNIDREQFLKPKNTDSMLEESGRILGQAFARQSLDTLQKYAASNPPFLKELQEISPSTNPISIDKAFSLDDSLYFMRNPDMGFNENMHHLRGEYALNLHDYNQAVYDFGKVIELNPDNHDAYLDRAIAHLGTKQYDLSTEDYQRYLEKKPSVLKDMIDYHIGYHKGVFEGIGESLKQSFLFAVDLNFRPISTIAEVIQGCVSLGKLAYFREWKTIQEVLVPEARDLAARWDSFSPEEKGEYAGYLFGKYGGDIMIQGAALKAFSKSSKAAKELSIACQSFQKAEKVLMVEALAGSAGKLESMSLETMSKIAQPETVVTARELGFTTRELAQLENVRKVENSISGAVKNIPEAAQDISFTTHALERAVERGISREAVLDALESPLKIGEVKVDNLGRPSQRFIGREAEVVINTETQQVVSVNPVSTKKINKLNRETPNVRD